MKFSTFELMVLKLLYIIIRHLASTPWTREEQDFMNEMEAIINPKDK